MLTRYRRHPDLRVRSELARAWNRFDTGPYGQEVIAYLDEQDLYFPVSNIRELQLPHKFGGRARIKIAGELTADEFVQWCHKKSLTHLWVEADMGEDWDWLSRFPRLGSLIIETSLPHIEIRPLGRTLSLREIRLPEGMSISGADLLPPSTQVQQAPLGAL